MSVAIFSEHATKVELCLFDSAEAPRESQRIVLPERTDMIWHGSSRICDPANSTACASTGLHEPARGLRFNPNKILLDPDAKAIARTVRWSDDMFG